MKTASGNELEKLLTTYTRITHEFEYAGGYAYRSELSGIIKGLGFTEEEFQKSIATLSGGQKTRIALGKLLLKKPDLILLDEPTNHLDMTAVNWLETYLQNYKGAVIIVSHDRYFLDRIVGKVVEISNTQAIFFTGNYTAYAEKKEKLRADEMKAYLNQHKEIKRQEAVIAKLRQFNREKQIKRAKSREKALSKIEILEKPAEGEKEIQIELNPAIESGNDVLNVDGLSKSFGDLILFQNISFNISRGEHIAIIGDNGTGKSTLLKILYKLINPDAGRLTLGTNVHIGYYDQDHHILNPDNNLIMEISDAYPAMSNTQIRNMLAAFLFTGDDVFNTISTLSGGERGRVALAKLMLSKANFLILDEPTNHLDIASKEILETALNRYTGTILYVSHDRYFINRTATRIFDLSAQTLTDYPGYGKRYGNYDNYLETKEMQTKNTSCETVSAIAPSQPASESKNDYLSRKEEQAAKRKQENYIRRLEEKIAEAEIRLKDIDRQMLMPELASNADELIHLTNEKEYHEDILNKLYEEWEANHS